MSDKFLTSDEIRKISDKEISAELSQARQNLAKTRIMINTGKENALHKAKNLKAYVARLLTIQNELKKAEKLK